MIRTMTDSIQIITLTESNADSFLLKFKYLSRNRYILIDGGLKGDGRKAIKLIEEIIKQGDIIDLVILTHVDLDHINGLLALFGSDIITSKTVGKVLFNVPHSKVELDIIKDNKTQCGYKEGNELLELIINKDIKFTPALQGDEFQLDDELVIDILSPTKSIVELDHTQWRNTNIGSDEDDEYNKELLLKKTYKEENKPQNISSIVCLVKYKDSKLLFCGDSVPSQILSGIPDVTPVDFFKITHHGSRYNISKLLIERFPSSKYLIPGNKTTYPNFYAIALLEDNSKDSLIYVPKGSWVHKETFNKNINLNFIEYKFNTKVFL
jgi:glyoxylase-like metal-dependent hydrolase (beta-lactamase superfamily II)